MGATVRGIDGTAVFVVDDMVEPDMLRNDIGGGVSMDVVEMGLGGGGRGGGDGERVDSTGGGSMSEAGISETSPGLPSSNGDSAEGGDGCSITTLFRRGELVRSDEAPRSGETGCRAFEGTEDVRVWDERRGDDWRVGRVSRSGIRLKVEVFRVCGGGFWVGSGDLEDDEAEPGPSLEEGSGCRGGSGVCGSWCADPFGGDVGNVLEFIAFDFWVVLRMPFVTGGGSSEDAIEGGESDEGNPIVDVGLGLPLVFTPFSGVSFEDVVDGGNVFPLIPRLPTLDGRDGGLTMGAGVTDRVLECRFGFS